MSTSKILRADEPKLKRLRTDIDIVIDDDDVVYEDFPNSQPVTPPSNPSTLKDILIRDFSEMIVISQSWLAKLSARSCRFLAPLASEIEDFNVRAVLMVSTLSKYHEIEIEEVTKDLWSEYVKLQNVVNATVLEEKESEDEKIGEESQGGEDLSGS